MRFREGETNFSKQKKEFFQVEKGESNFQFTLPPASEMSMNKEISDINYLECSLVKPYHKTWNSCFYKRNFDDE